jgi:hypothetical protein
MSDFSLLYKKYASVSNLTNDLNNSVITLKRKNLSSKKEVLEAHPEIKVSEDEITKAQGVIVTILSALEHFYNNLDTNDELYDLMDNSLFKNQIMNNAEFKQEIIEALKKIKSNADLNKKDLANIDKFISVLDNEAAFLFRKLRTNRA